MHFNLGVGFSPSLIKKGTLQEHFWARTREFREPGYLQTEGGGAAFYGHKQDGGLYST